MRELVRSALARHEARGLNGSGLREAAVLLLLYESAGVDHVLFQVRTQRVRFHKGEISLPGGGIDATDRGPLEAALRETREEIGVAPEHIEVLGRLDGLATRSGFAVTPFVGAMTLGAPYPFALADREVAELLTVPLPHLRSEEAVRWVLRELDGERAAEREFHYGEHRIWGVTARILGNFFDVLTAAEAGEPVVRS